MSTVANLLADIKLKAQLQADSTVISDADILSMANKELQSVIVPKILAVRENYFWGFKDFTIVSTQHAYRIPSRAVGAKITAVKIIESDSKVYSLARKHPNDLSSRLGYKIIGDSIWISSPGGDQPTGTLRIEYQISPPTMVASPTAEVCHITAVNATNFTLSASTTGSYELIKPSGSQNTICFLTCSTTTATCPDDLIGDTLQGLVAVGDSVIGLNATHLVPLPVELHDWLAQRVVMRIHEYLGHRDEMELAGAKLADMERDGLTLITPRAEEDIKTISDKEVLNWRTW